MEKEGIPSEDNELIWDFIMLCETMSLRKLQLACGWLHDGGECPRAAQKKAGRIDFCVKKGRLRRAVLERVKKLVIARQCAHCRGNPRKF